MATKEVGVPETRALKREEGGQIWQEEFDVTECKFCLQAAGGEEG